MISFLLVLLATAHVHGADIVHDTEYYILEVQNAENLAADYFRFSCKIEEKILQRIV